MNSISSEIKKNKNKTKTHWPIVAILVPGRVPFNVECSFLSSSTPVNEAAEFDVAIKVIDDGPPSNRLVDDGPYLVVYRVIFSTFFFGMFSRFERRNDDEKSSVTGSLVADVDLKKKKKKSRFFLFPFCFALRKKEGLTKNRIRFNKRNSAKPR